MRLWFALTLSLGCAPCSLSLSSCKQGTELSEAGAQAGDALAPDQASRVLAKVGNRTITLGDYVAAYEHMDQFDRMRYESPERRKALLAEMIDVMLLADEAKEHGFDQDPVTQQEIREILRDAVLKQVQSTVPAPNEIPEEDVRNYFQAHRSDFHDPERRRVSAIVLADAPAAASVLESAQKNPAAWGDLVRSRSIDPQARADVPAELAGDLGFVSPPGDARGTNPRIPEDVRVAVFQLDRVGDIAPRVVRAEGKAYVVRLAAKTAPQDRSLQDVERTVRVKLVQERMKAREAELLVELRKQFPVQIDEQALAQVKVELPDASGTRELNNGGRN